MAASIKFAFTSDSELQTITFDATLKESHDMAAEVTDYPVEEGSDVSDNIRPKPRTLQLDGIISDAPLGNAGRTQTPGGSTPGENKQPSEDTRSKNALKLLEQVRDEGVKVDVFTGLKRYPSMAITNIHTDRDKMVKGALKLTIQLKELVIVSGQTVSIQNAKEPAGKTKTSKGKQTPKAATDPNDKAALSTKLVDGAKNAAQGVIDAIKGK